MLSLHKIYKFVQFKKVFFDIIKYNKKLIKNWIVKEVTNKNAAKIQNCEYIEPA